MVETPTSKEPVAVVDIGSSGIRMIIAEIGPKLSIRYLENVQKAVSFGKDVFTSGRLSPSAIRQGIDILNNYKAMLDTYGVRRMQAIATSAVREAANRDNFIDQVFVRTGIDVEVIEGAEENRLNLIAVEHALEGRFDFEKTNCLIMEVGTGSTEIIATSRGEVALTRTLLIGPLRLPDQAESGKIDSPALQRLLKRRVGVIADEFRREFDLGGVDSFIAMGASMRFLSKQFNGQDDSGLGTLEPRDFNEFLKSIAKLSAEEISDKYGMPYTDAETLYASLFLYEDFLSETKANKVLVPMVSIRDGLLLEMAQLVSGYKRTDLSRQVIHSARNLGKKYNYNEAHALAVSSIALKLFDALKDDHGLGPRERLLLEVSALLHDIGTFISATSHHKHSAYLIEAAEIFGLRKVDKDIVANVARYHRRSQPKLTHPDYMALSRADRAVVSKLAAILRVAEALDASHQQKCKDFTIERKGPTCSLWVPEEVGDLSLERQSLSRKNDMLPDILGVSVTLKQGVPTASPSLSSPRS
jgi:exopolyphosphatase/guanosine-5'-triphosphate,3'-diphosphate pyrophosphatase